MTPKRLRLIAQVIRCHHNGDLGWKAIAAELEEHAEEREAGKRG